MKKILPIALFGILILGLLAFLLVRSGPVLDLKPFVKGEMVNFVVFDDPKTLPETPFFDRDGREFRLTDFRGKTMLVNFWATWCEPCKEEMPTLQILQAELGGDKFQVITVSVDWQGFEVMDPFFREFKINLLDSYWDNSGRLPNELETIGLPLTILISADGEWLGRADGPLAWDSADAVELFKVASGSRR